MNIPLWRKQVSKQIGWFVVLGAIVGWSEHAFAQRRPIADETLGGERSIVTPLDPDIPVDVIEGGAERGDNLFHSFREFHVDEGRGVYFDDRDFANIISRVTGGVASDILGVLGVLGDANLFLINSNGIIFGPNARLDVRGSFIATTANAIQFGEQGLFSASEMNAPPLLTVQPSAFLFNQIAAQPINSIENRGALRVPANESLLLVGGNVSPAATATGAILIDGGLLRVPDGRIELAGVSAPGVIGLDIVNSQFRLQFPNNIARSDISLTNEAIVNASGNSGGSIQVYGRAITVDKASAILSNTLGTGTGGDLNVNASELVQLSDTTEDGIISGLATQLEGTGTAGDITIQTRRLVIQGGAQVSTGVFGTGTGGNLNVIATDSIEITDVLNNGLASGLFTQAVEGSSGNSGDLMIQTRQLRLLNGAEISSANFSNNGSGGDISLMATDSIEVSGFRGRLPSNLGTSAFGEGDAGDLTIQTRQLIIQNGGVIAASAFGDGTGGTLRIDARQLLMQNGAGLGATTSGEGDGGDLIIEASDSVQIVGGRSLSILTVGSGNRENTGGDAGNLSIRTGRLLLRDGAQISASTLGGGEGGNLTVVASDSVQVSGTLGVEGAPSGLFASTEGIGNAGALTVQTRQLTIQNGGRVSVSAFGESSQGNGGRLTVNASDSVRVTGVADDGQRTSLLTAETEGTGNAGGLLINTGQLQVQDGATVSVASAGSSQAGGLRVNARAISLNNRANITAATEAGAGGNIELQISDFLRLRNNSVISASTETGRAGSLQVEADSIQLEGRGGLFVESTQGGTAGNLTIDTDRLIVRDRARVSVSSTGLGRAGDLNVTARDLFLDDRARLLADTESGRGANINLSVSDTLRLFNNSRISATTDNEQGGQFTLNVDRNPTRLVELDSSSISTEATGTGDAGNLTLNIRQLNLQDGSEISASTRSGMGGGIILRGINSLQVDNSNVSASTQTGRAGSLRINAESIELNNQGQLAVSATGQNGEAGDLSLRTGQLTLNEAGITVNSAAGRAGNLNITADTIQLNQGNLTAETAVTSGDAGANINLQNVDLLLMQNGSQISANASEDASGGNVNIDASDGFIVAIPNQNNDITASAPVGQGGNIQITTQGIFGLEERPAITGNGTNDIAATGGSPELSGTVELNTPDVDPTQGLTELPTDVVDASNQIAQTCPTPGSRTATSTLNEFIITGRGGLPPSPIDPLIGEESLADWVAIEPEEEIAITPSDPANIPPDIANSSATAAPIVEAQGWMVDEQGEVLLVAEVPAVSSRFPVAIPENCP